jgi:hypothetical protein
LPATALVKDDRIEISIQINRPPQSSDGVADFRVALLYYRNIARYGNGQDWREKRICTSTIVVHISTSLSSRSPASNHQYNCEISGTKSTQETLTISTQFQNLLFFLPETG